MKCFRVGVALVTMIAFLAGCSAKRLPDYSPLPAHQYSQKETLGDLTVAIYPMTQETEIKEYFGMNLLSADILPVTIVVENRNPELHFILRKDEIKLVNQSTQRFDRSNNPETVGSSTGEKTVGAIALLSPLAAGMMIGMISNAAEMKRNFAMKEFQQATISPGETKSGFVYFQLPKPEASPIQWRFEIQAMDVKNKNPLTFTYVFDWKRSM
jgi:hypothetical protein